MAWKGIVARHFTLPEYEEYVKSINWVLWRPSGITLHHTAEPNIENRPKGLTLQHIRNIEYGYINDNHWNSGPHDFIDQNGVWQFTPLTIRGVHAVSFNRTHLGIEMLGDYDSHDWNPAVRANAVGAMAILCRRLGLTEKDINFHRDDPQTSKTCPGTHISKTTVQNDVRLEIAKQIATGNKITNQALVIVNNKWTEAIQATIIKGRVYAPANDLLKAFGQSNVTPGSSNVPVAVAPYAMTFGYEFKWNAQQKKLYLYK